jgi:carbonic anhydrase
MGSIGPIGLIVVMHHTGQYLQKVEKGGAANFGGDCGGLFTTDDEVREKISKRAPEHAGTVKGKWFGTFRQWAFAIVEVDVY